MRIPMIYLSKINDAYLCCFAETAAP